MPIKFISLVLLVRGASCEAANHVVSTIALLLPLSHYPIREWPHHFFSFL